MKQSAMTMFILAWLYKKQGNSGKSEEILKRAQRSSYDYLFPSRLYEQLVLEWVLDKPEFSAVAAYGLGNYYYNHKRHRDAISVWSRAAEMNCGYASLHRNLGIAYWNTFRDGDKARRKKPR